MNKIEQAIREQIESCIYNWNHGINEFGFLSMNLIRKNSNITVVESWDDDIQKEIKRILKKLCKEYNVKFDKEKNCIYQIA